MASRGLCFYSNRELFYLWMNEMRDFNRVIFSVSYKLGLILSISVFTLMLTIKNVWAGKKHCKQYHVKLMNIQSQQKSFYTQKAGERLAKKEDKARKKWWDCEQGKLFAPRTSKKAHNARSVTQRESSKKTQSSLASTQNSQPFKTSQPITINSEFTGRKQREWIAYYQTPEQCMQPENYKVFVWCVEFKKTKSKAFNESYSSKALKE